MYQCYLHKMKRVYRMSRYDSSIAWLFNGTSRQKGQFVPNAVGRKLAQAAKDGQRDAMRNTSRYTISSRDKYDISSLNASLMICSKTSYQPAGILLN